MSEKACGAVEASCCCDLAADHAEPFHHCDCGGEWRHDENGFEIKTLPGVFGAIPIEVLADVLR